jgi:hypothetical protein
MNTRTILIIIAAVVVILGLGVGAYFMFFTSSPGVAVSPGGTLPANGTTGQGNQNQQGGSGSNVAGSPVKIAERLIKIDSGPVVSGEIVLDQKSVSSTTPGDISVQYLQRQSGNIYSYLVRAGTLTRISNKTVPGIQSASWLPNGSMAYVRYLSGNDFSIINTYALPANGSNGFFLPQNLNGISVASSSVLALAVSASGATGSLLHTDGTKNGQAFSTPLSMLSAQFAGKGAYLVYTKPSSTLDGYAYIVDSTGRFSLAAGPGKGLSALASPSGKWLVVSFMTGTAMQLELVNTTSHETISLPIGTIADKCVWAADDSVVYCGVPKNPSSNFAYPDDWYQGAAHFSDQIWKINVTGRYAQLVLDIPTVAKTEVDATALAVDPASQELVFLNKNDGSLWAYAL